MGTLLVYDAIMTSKLPVNYKNLKLLFDYSIMWYVMRFYMFVNNSFI